MFLNNFYKIILLISFLMGLLILMVFYLLLKNLMFANIYYDLSKVINLIKIINQIHMKDHLYEHILIFNHLLI
jgi:hypothetical protein